MSSLPLGLPQTGQGQAEVFLQVIELPYWATELPPASLPRNLALVYHEEVWLLQSLVALLQLPQSVWRSPGPRKGELLSRKTSRLPVVLPLPGLPHQDKSEKSLAGLWGPSLAETSGTYLLQSWEKKEQGSSRSK